MMWQTQTTIEYPFALRPASIEEAGLFYSQMDEAEDAVLGTVGHIRMDFGASGKEFYHTWWPHNGDQFNTGEFKDELQKFVDMLRADGPLTNLASMRNYCYQHGGTQRMVLFRKWKECQMRHLSFWTLRRSGKWHAWANAAYMFPVESPA